MKFLAKECLTQAFTWTCEISHGRGNRALLGFYR